MSTTVFVILPQEYDDLTDADGLEQTLKLMLHRREIAHASRSYWDDSSYEIEYGVRLDIHDLSHEDEAFQRLLGEIVIVTAQLHGSIRIQLGG